MGEDKMPYITREKRGLLNTYIRSLNNIIRGRADKNSLMAYVIYKLLKDEYVKYGWDTKSDPLKILEDVKLEYYDRVLRPHADKKIEENGDI